MQQYLYVMLSHTDTGMGRVIRFCTGEYYNHVSLTLNGDFQNFVSFARYHKNVPLAGGYITESASRLLSCGKSMPVRIFQIPISQTEALKLSSIFQMADQSDLIYNSIGALLAGCHLHCTVPGAYTCLEFANAILGTSFTSIKRLNNELSQWEIYSGDLFHLLKNDGNRSTPFFQKRSFKKGTVDTVIHFKTLLWRILRLEHPSDPISQSILNILSKNMQQSSV